MGANGLFSDVSGARREINWDGVPAGFSAPNNLPANFFNVNSPRGVVFSTSGTGFQVSSATTDAGPGQPALADFGNINPSYTTLFQPFSPQRLFTALGSNVLDVNIFVPGTTIPAFTSAFGVVFSDVDLANITSLTLFAPNGSSLGTFFAPATSGNETFSFLGVQGTSGEQIARVRIASGNTALGAGVNEGVDSVDLVVMDDFLYVEPRAVPEPASLVLVLLGLAVIGMSIRPRLQRN
jgi:hypothetical protein